ncbi:hypothetical protein RHMOL_Rhmol10G0103200 [Rhododendron molle]|uniref:Uncharacterized protein n=1 Tax=Rhododendron molle TaxID=49168 RepID=A0ACC0M1X4_RHOML|nr:hypothetical protein RHMOL_Rhmol10G0103200 [Rhododendron molle]
MKPLFPISLSLLMKETNLSLSLSLSSHLAATIFTFTFPAITTVALLPPSDIMQKLFNDLERRKKREF